MQMISIQISVQGFQNTGDERITHQRPTRIRYNAVSKTVNILSESP
jgi:hypothetical protein